jgi:signal transduction histidine kinase/CheY-like chemotaxis protein
VYEHVLPMPSGPRVYNTALIPLFDETGRVHRLASVARDVTARHDTEQQSRRLEAQLAEAQKGEALARLATHVAHDVTGLLAVVDAHAQHLQAGSTSAADATVAILETTARGRALTQRLATLGRRRPDQRRPVELQPLVDEALRQVSATAPAVELVRAVTPGLVVSGDAGQLRQAVVSLVANALEAMPDGGRCTVTLSGMVVDDAFAAQHPPLRTGPHARLEVHDTGRGLDPSTRRRLFEPYFSATGLDGAGKRDGLGLSVVQAVVTGHDGAVLVHSAEGQGTRFEVYLPALDEAVVQPGEGQHLMLVDDHPGMARVSAKLLETLGYRTSVFDDPREALQAFRLAPMRYDAVLTDLSMPQMSGEDFTRSLRELRPTLPVIVSSGMATELDRAQLDRLGVSAVLLKPWRLEEAVATLQRVLA